MRILNDWNETVQQQTILNNEIIKLLGVNERAVFPYWLRINDILILNTIQYVVKQQKSNIHLIFLSISIAGGIGVLRTFLKPTSSDLTFWFPSVSFCHFPSSIVYVVISLVLPYNCFTDLASTCRKGENIRMTVKRSQNVIGINIKRTVIDTKWWKYWSEALVPGKALISNKPAHLKIRKSVKNTSYDY